MTASFASIVAATAVAATFALMGIAAWSDIATRIIPDRVSAGVALAGLCHRALDGIAMLALTVGIASVLFGLLVAAHARGWLGGGDVKLMAAAVLGFTPTGTMRFLMAMAVAGFVLAMLHLLLRRLPLHRLKRTLSRATWRRATGRRTTWRRVMAAEGWRIRRHGSLPYGVAIAFGSVWVLLTGSGG